MTRNLQRGLGLVVAVLALVTLTGCFPGITFDNGLLIARDLPAVKPSGAAGGELTFENGCLHVGDWVAVFAEDGSPAWDETTGVLQFDNQTFAIGDVLHGGGVVLEYSRDETPERYCGDGPFIFMFDSYFTRPGD